MAVFLLVVGLTAYFYHLLPGEVAIRFDSAGLPDSWLSRAMTLLLVLLPQLLLVVVGVGLAWIMTRLSRRYHLPARSKTSLKTIVVLMGNMVVLPQIVLGFAMADIFVYNAYQVHLMPLWAFALAIMAVGGVVIGVLFFRAIRPELGK